MKRSSVLGVTLLEIMLVLAIAAMVVVMSIRYYQSARASQQANDVLEQLQAIAAAADSLAQPSGSYVTAGVSATTLSPLLQAGGNAFVTPWGTTITITGVSASSYTITVPGTPAAVCALVVSKLSINTHFSNLTPASAAGCGVSATPVSYTYLANP